MAAPVVGVASAITAAGTNAATAFDLTGYVGVNIVSTCAAGAGVQLPVAPPGFNLLLANTAANVCLVYPQTGGQINSLTVSTGAYTLGVGAIVEFFSKDGLNWVTGPGGSATSTGIPLLSYITYVANATVTPSQSGLVIGLGTGAANYTITLPTAAAGLNYTFVCSTAAEAKTVTVTSTTALMYGRSIAADATAVTTPLSATLTTNYIFGTSSVVGDSIGVKCLDGTHWICDSYMALHGAGTVS
jgi:hypothetical protein